MTGTKQSCYLEGDLLKVYAVMPDFVYAFYPQEMNYTKFGTAERHNSALAHIPYREDELRTIALGISRTFGIAVFGFDVIVEPDGRIVVIDVMDDNPLVLINPEIVEQDGEQTGYEGCLSVPGKLGVVTRPNRVVVRYNDLDMNEWELEAEEFLARAVCHELDHLDGHLYVEKVEGELMEVKHDEDDE